MDKFAEHKTQLDSPASAHFAITPSDDTDFTTYCRAIYCGSAGDVAVVDLSGTVAVYKVLQGTRLDIRARRVNDSGTDATNLVGMV